MLGNVNFDFSSLKWLMLRDRRKMTAVIGEKAIFSFKYKKERLIKKCWPLERNHDISWQSKEFSKFSLTPCTIFSLSSPSSKIFRRMSRQMLLIVGTLKPSPITVSLSSSSLSSLPLPHCLIQSVTIRFPVGNWSVMYISLRCRDIGYFWTDVRLVLFVFLF